MYLIPIAWLYVALMMSLAEATNTNGTVLGGVVTFVFYGVLPVLLVTYLLGTPSRRRALKAQEQLAQAEAAADAIAVAVATPSDQPDAGGQAATGGATVGGVAVGKED
jgi:hypothetical protein